MALLTLSKTNDTPFTLRIQAYRDLSVLNAELVFTDALTLTVPSLSEDTCVTVPAATIAALPTGQRVVKFNVYNSGGALQVSYLLDAEIVSGLTAADQEVFLAIPNVIHIATGSGTVEDLINGRVKVNKFLFGDTDGNEFIVTAMMDGGYPVLKVEKVG